MPSGDLTGHVLDARYRVIEPIGEGAMGTVYRGERLKLGLRVAIKVISEEIVTDASRKRFEREAMAMAKLEHPHCATVLDVGVHVGRPYVVMEFVSGQNLKELIKLGPVPRLRAVELTRQILSGLSHAHEHGIIHRDIKPANIVLSQKAGLGDHAKILDFGLARFSNQESSNLTAGLVLGTPNYMAPEQIRGGNLDHRVDLYACGVMLFELLTGSKPFEATDPVAVCFMHLNDPPPRLADKSDGRAFGPLEDVVAKALAKDPNERFATADEFSTALAEAMAQPLYPEPVLAKMTIEPPQPRRSKPMPTPRGKLSPLVYVVGGVAALGIAAIVVAATRKESPKPPIVAPAPPPTTAPPPDAPAVATNDPIEDLLARARAEVAAGHREDAIDDLVRARKSFPTDARIPLLAAKLYLEKMWWADGMKQARAAIQLDPKVKSDADLIKLVLRGFNMTKSYDATLARFLREDIGEPAKPFLENTAKTHTNAIVRARARAELRRY